MVLARLLEHVTPHSAGIRRSEAARIIGRVYNAEYTANWPVKEPGWRGFRCLDDTVSEVWYTLRRKNRRKTKLVFNKLGRAALRRIFVRNHVNEERIRLLLIGKILPAN